MSIAFQHLQRLVARDGRYFHGVEAFLEKAAGGLVAEIVEAQPFKVSTLAGNREVRSHRSVGRRKNPAVDVARQGFQRRDGRLDNGTRLAVPFFVSGSTATLPFRSICSQRNPSNSAARMAVSIARTTAGYNHVA